MKVKYVKAKGNDCVHRALSSLTGMPRTAIAKALPIDKTGTGVSYKTWRKFGEKQGITFKDMKTPIPTTLGAIQTMSKSHKSGIIVRATSDKGNHAFFVKNGKITDDVKKANKNSVMTLNTIAYKD